MNEYDRVIRDEIDNANAKVDEGRDDEEKDLLPNCDLTVWLRDYKDEVLRPLQGTTSGKPTSVIFSHVISPYQTTTEH